MAKTSQVWRSAPAQNLLAATAAGVAVLVRPARFPVWARRSLSLANTAGTAGAAFLGNRKTAADGGSPLEDQQPRSTSSAAAAAGSLLAATAGGLTFFTSRLGLKADAKVEGYLVRKGVKHPRVWMAVGAVGVVFVIKTAQDAAAAKANDKVKALVAAKQGQAGATAAPAGTRADQLSTPATSSGHAPQVTPTPEHEQQADTEHGSVEHVEPESTD